MKIMKILFLSIVLVGLSFLEIPEIYALQNTEPTLQEQEQLILLWETITRVRNNYIEKRSNQELIDAAINGIISSLDKHSNYMSPEIAQKERQEITGSFYGIGIEIAKHKETGYIKIISLVEGSPAKAAGLFPLDLIKSVNGTELNELDFIGDINAIRGPENSEAKMIIIRNGKEISVTVIRKKIELPTVRSRMLEHDIAYVKLTRFNNVSTSEMKKAFVKLRVQLTPRKVFRGVILDLRDNPGGVIDQATAISDLFLNEGTIVSVIGRDGKLLDSVTATPGQIISSNTPMIILINEGSASASEIVTGTLKDLERATIVGVKSYGKGSVQAMIPLSNDGILNVTIAKYYTAGGTTPHEVGITPDIIVEIPEGYWEQIPILERRTHIDPQLKKAIEMILLKNPIL